jgi:hypothetical protein
MKANKFVRIFRLSFVIVPNFFFFENLNEHFLDTGIFCKKPETGQFLFLLAHILAYVVFAYLLPEVRNHL